MRMNRRQFLRSVAAAAGAAGASARTLPRVSSSEVETPHLATPTPEQRSWQDMELGLFIHFGMFVCGSEPAPDPSVYNPRRLDTDQWLEVARSMGARYAVFTAKHGTGFLQWPSDAYPYGVRQSKWRGGKGDAVRAFIDSCHKYGIEPGLYACVHYNAWWKVFGKGRVASGKPEEQKRYARACQKLLGELWSRYGELAEIWFDGGVLAPEEGGPDIVPLVRRLQPRAMVFQGPASTIRWVGNERGVAGYPCWATVPSREAAMRDARVMGHGDPEGRLWLPGECDVPLPGHGWNWSADQKKDIEPLAALMDMYARSVGRNCNLLLNATPNADGVIPEENLRHYAAFGKEIRRRYGKPLARSGGSAGSGGRSGRSAGGGDGGGGAKAVEVALAEPAVVDRVTIAEEIEHGERIRAYRLEGLDASGAWRRLAEGTSVGHKRIEIFEPLRLSRVRLRIPESVAPPRVRKLAVHAAG